MTTILTTTLTTAARPTTPTTAEKWSYRAWSGNPPGPGSVGVRGSSPLSSTRKTLGRRRLGCLLPESVRVHLSLLCPTVLAENTADAAVSRSSVTRP